MSKITKEELIIFGVPLFAALALPYLGALAVEAIDIQAGIPLNGATAFGSDALRGVTSASPAKTVAVHRP